MKQHDLRSIQKRELNSMPARIAAGLHSGGIHGSGSAESMPILNQTQSFLQRKTQEDVTRDAADVITTDRASNETAGNTSI